MNKEQQIEEMAHILATTQREDHCGKIGPCQRACPYYTLPCIDCEMGFCAEALYNAGYRKSEAFSQPHENGGEWISVEDRLPKAEKILSRHDGSIGVRSIRVLCSCRQKNGKIFVKEGYYEKWDFAIKPHWRIPGSIDTVTHWMPLPEPPKMKGE